MPKVSNKSFRVVQSDLHSNMVTKMRSSSSSPSSSLVSLLVVFSFCVRTLLCLELASYPLPKNLHPSKKYVTVSGVETGGVIAQHLHMSYSKVISGIAVYSSSFYRCGSGYGKKEDYIAQCTKHSTLPYSKQYKITDAVNEIQGYHNGSQIDDVKYLRYSKLYVYCGLYNNEFSPEQQLSVISLYERYLASPYSIFTRVQNSYEHLPTIDTSETDLDTCPMAYDEYGTVPSSCTSMSVPAEALGFLLSKWMPYINPFYPVMRKVNLEPLRTFDQTEFLKGLEYPCMDESGYYYIPRYCQYKMQAHRYNYGYKHSYSKPCFVHVYFHGCRQGREFVGTTYVLESNYLEIAELNNIIMVFPQALSCPASPDGCFDYIGYTDKYYATKSGQQVTAVWRMLEKLLGMTSDKETYSKMAYSNAQRYERGGPKIIQPMGPSMLPYNRRVIN